MKLKSVILVGVGVLLGCGAAVVAPLAQSKAQTKNTWACYAVEEFPTVRSANEAAGDIQKGMDQVAPAVTPGTVISVTPKSHPSGSSASVVCVKYQ